MKIMKKMLAMLAAAAFMMGISMTALADQLVILGDSGKTLTISDAFVCDELTAEDAQDNIVGYYYDGHTDMIIREIQAEDTGTNLQKGAPENAVEVREGEKVIHGTPAVWCTYTEETEQGSVFCAEYAFLTDLHELQISFRTEGAEDPSSAIMNTLADAGMVSLGRSHLYLQLGAGYQIEELDSEDVQSGLVAFYLGDTLEISVYRYPADGLTIDDILEDYAEDEELEINNIREINGIEVGSYFGEGNDGVETYYRLGNILEDSDDIVEIIIDYRDHADADDAVALMDTLCRK